MFQVNIENVAPVYAYTASDVFNTPVGTSSPAPIGPGEAYEFNFSAAPGSRLSFATMFVHSNDLFFAPAQSGIELYDSMGNQNIGDVTSQINLWDAGTEVNQEPGIGVDQAPRQSGPNNGASDSNMNVRLAMDTYGNLPSVHEVIQVTIQSTSQTGFRVRIENVSDMLTLQTSDGSSHSVPLAPGVWVIHGMDNPLFTSGMPLSDEGLEAIAEDGNPSLLGDVLENETGITQIIAPGVWANHTNDNPLFVDGMLDNGDGLEALAEDGSPDALNSSVMSMMDVLSNGIFNTPTGNSNPGPVLPGGSYSFEFEAADGYLSFATMLVQSNDLFLSPNTMGIQLFNNSGTAINGDITHLLSIWDAGTEVNEEPGIGLYQAPRQSGPDMGLDENGNVRLVNDMFNYPDLSNIIRVTISGM